jgi:hypothetical protein
VDKKYLTLLMGVDNRIREEKCHVFVKASP